MAPEWLDELDLRADGPPWLAMGLRRVGEEAWLAPDENRRSELSLRRSLIGERPREVLYLGPGTVAAGAEVLELVEAWLGTHLLGGHAGETGRNEARARCDALDDTAPGTDPAAPHDVIAADDEHPLVRAGRLVQEDLCLMVPRPGTDGRRVHHLDAAVLCFPSHWRLADKVGRPAAALHGPVPRYDGELSVRVDRYLDRLRPGVIGLRRNWSVHDSEALFAPDPPIDPRPVGVDGVAARLWLRSERQTLRALAGSGAVLFTIRVQQAPFAVLAERPDVAGALAARLRAQPAELVAMNGLAPHRRAVLTWLDRVARRDGSG